VIPLHKLTNHSSMEFNPSNPIVKRCLQGMDMADNGKPEEASRLFHQAWNEATDDLEKFIAAYFVARHQQNTANQLQWYETALKTALRINNDTVYSAFASLYNHIADGYEALGDPVRAKKHRESAALFADKPIDQ